MLNETSLTVTLAPAMAPPLASVIVPRTEVVPVWGLAIPMQNRDDTTNKRAKRRTGAYVMSIPFGCRNQFMSRKQARRTGRLRHDYPQGGDGKKRTRFGQIPTTRLHRNCPSF